MGKNFALRLIAEGYLVYATARRFDRLEAVRTAGGRTLTMDETDDDSMSSAVERSSRSRDASTSSSTTPATASTARSPLLLTRSNRRFRMSCWSPPMAPTTDTSSHPKRPRMSRLFWRSEPSCPSGRPSVR
ncbi:hypothetical protein [Mitsuaria sp. CC2]|uniref:hypothetical protein n=1 Tax=Mitsuaria sp. CC2 TaxID=3029186 RepID=UPI003B9EDCAB